MNEIDKAYNAGHRHGYQEGRDAERERVLAWLDRRLDDIPQDGSFGQVCVRHSIVGLRDEIRSGEEAPQ